MEIEVGSMIDLFAYGGEVITRRVVEVEGGVVHVCRKEEFESAQRERRQPRLVGFKIADVKPND